MLSTETLTGSTDLEEYLSCCATADHVLLDPDTGVRLGGSRPSVAHLPAATLSAVVRARPSALTAVFDQSFNRGQHDPELRAKLEYFRQRGIHGFGYRSHACFLFLSPSEACIGEAWRLLTDVLPPNRLVGRHVAEDAPVDALQESSER